MSTFYELQRMSFKESAEFISQHIGKALLFEDLNKFWSASLKRIPSRGLILEFGVFKGYSINFFSKLLYELKDDRFIYGFDSFKGITSDWYGTDKEFGHFKLDEKLPTTNSNVELIVGQIEETLKAFLLENAVKEKKIAFIHMDVDTYQSSKYILEETVNYFESGSVIVFDELLGYPGWKQHEFKALNEVVLPKWEFEFIAFCEPMSLSRPKSKSKFVRGAIKIIQSKKQ